MIRSIGHWEIPEVVLQSPSIIGRWWYVALFIIAFSVQHDVSSDGRVYIGGYHVIFI